MTTKPPSRLNGVWYRSNRIGEGAYLDVILQVEDGFFQLRHDGIVPTTDRPSWRYSKLLPPNFGSVRIAAVRADDARETMVLFLDGDRAIEFGLTLFTGEGPATGHQLVLHTDPTEVQELWAAFAECAEPPLPFDD